MNWWPFTSNNSLIDSGLLKGMTDYHSHILPGVDDGIKELNSSLAALKMYEQLGIREVWCTPHIMDDCPNTTEQLRTSFDELCSAYMKVCGEHPVSLHLGAEYMLGPLFRQRLEAGDLLPIIDSRHLLVETSYLEAPLGFTTLLQSIMKQGYFILLAHPERYTYMEMSDYDSLLIMGVRFQLNLPSLWGQYGARAQKIAIKLLAKGYYNYVGTDLHSHLALLKWPNIKISRKLQQNLSLYKQNQ